MADDIIDVKARGEFNPIALVDEIPFAVAMFSLILTVAAALMGYAVDWEQGLYGWEIFLPFFLVVAVLSLLLSLRHVLQMWLLET